MRRPASIERRVIWILTIVVALTVAALALFRIAAANRETLARSVASPLSGRFVQAGDIQMFVQENGPPDGRAVLFIHGIGAWSQIWRRTMDTLAASGFHVVAVDMPPFGFSERPATADYSDEAQGRRILDLVEALHLTGITLVGHSFGARSAMEAYFLDSSRFSRIVLVDAATGLSEMGKVRPPRFALRTLLAIAPLRNAVVAATLTNPALTRRLLRRFVSDESTVTPEYVAMVQRQLTVENTTPAIGAWLRPFLLSHERSLVVMSPLYESIDVPTLVLWGESDLVTPVADGRGLAKLIPGAKLVELPGVGHMPLIEAPQRFNAELMQFLQANTERPTLVAGNVRRPGAGMVRRTSGQKRRRATS
jgi:pimeloyl-ACP methyl ester carboxylesterase